MPTEEKTSYTYLDAVRTALESELDRDEDTFLIGEDVGQFGGAAREFTGSPGGLEDPVAQRGAGRRELPGEFVGTVFELIETGPGGNYAADVTLPEAGYYQVIMRDTTYPQEDAVAEILLNLDGETEFGAPLFIFPPTDIGGASLGTWLVWLVALPIAAGVIVTISVLGTKPKDGKGEPAS